MVSGWVKDSHRCGLPLQPAAPTQAFKTLPPPLPHLSWQISTQSHPSPPPRLPRPSITAWTHWNTQPAAAVSSRQSLTSEQGFLRAQTLIAIPLPVFFSKILFFFWFYQVSFFFLLVTHFRAAVAAHGYIVRCSVRDEIHLNESLKV